MATEHLQSPSMDSSEYDGIVPSTTDCTIFLSFSEERDETMGSRSPINRGIDQSRNRSLDDKITAGVVVVRVRLNNNISLTDVVIEVPDIVRSTSNERLYEVNVEKPEKVNEIRDKGHNGSNLRQGNNVKRGRVPDLVMPVMEEIVHNEEKSVKKTTLVRYSGRGRASEALGVRAFLVVASPPASWPDLPIVRPLLGKSGD